MYSPEVRLTGLDDVRGRSFFLVKFLTQMPFLCTETKQETINETDCDTDLVVASFIPEGIHALGLLLNILTGPSGQPALP